MQRCRARLRAEGLRPVQLWVRDTRSPAFVREFRRQARAVAAREATSSREVDALLESQDTAGWR